MNIDPELTFLIGVVLPKQSYLIDNKVMLITPAVRLQRSKEYATHFNYAHCMVGMMHDLSITVPIDKTAVINEGESKRFLKLAKLTEKSIEGEVLSCQSEEDYSQIVAPWIAVKCYYRAYYLESVLIHLVSGTDEVYKNGGHNYVRKIIHSYCKVGYFDSHFKKAEEVVNASVALGHTISAGGNLSAKYYLTDDCVKSVRRKIADYGLEHWKKNSGYKNFRSNKARAALSAYISRSEHSLFDYFYQMRLKANYRDSDFLDFAIITSAEGKKYIEMIKLSTDKYCSALQNEIHSICQQRNISL